MKKILYVIVGLCLIAPQLSSAQVIADNVSLLEQDRHSVNVMYNQTIPKEELSLEQKNDVWWGRFILMGVLKGEHSSFVINHGDKSFKVCPQASSIDEIRLIKFDVKDGNRVAKLSSLKMKKDIEKEDIKDSKINEGIKVPYKKLNENYIELDCGNLKKGEYGIVIIVNKYYFANYAFTFSII